MASSDGPRDPAPAAAVTGSPALADTLPSPPAAPPPLPRGTALGRYLTLERIGAGGMGVVYAAYDPELDRKVALKLLHPDPEPRRAAEQIARLRLEAQAMARLDHPNVVAVHDVGTFQGQVFLAMDLVEGGTLAAWLAQGRRPWREVLAVFMGAGEGLAAAHAAGIVHRDFKPDNVLLGADGRARVTDFGLARPLKEGGAAPPATLVSPGLEETLAGSLVGTPAYMSPEQLAGLSADARSDQFGFCVSLYEGLYGARPFGGENLTELAAAVAAGQVAEPPPGSRVPPWLRRVLLRGLSLSPQARHPTMEALLGELARDPVRDRPRRLAVIAALLLAGLGVAAFASSRGAERPLCRGARQKLAAVWDEPARAEIQRAFADSGQPFAEAAWRSVAARLDAYADAWVAMHTEACEATRVRGEQSDEVLGLRMDCLERRRGELHALRDLFARADRGVVERAVQAAGDLTPLDLCADQVALAARVRPPEGKQARARVEALQEKLAAVQAQYRGGQFPEGLRAARAVAAEAPAAGYRPVEAEAHYWAGKLALEAGEAAAAEASLQQALLAAEAGRHDEVLSRASLALAFQACQAGRVEQGQLWAGLAAAALERLGGDAALEAELENTRGFLARGQGRYPEARAHFEKALALREARAGGDALAVAQVLNNLGIVSLALGDLEPARQAFDRSLKLREQAVGAQHPAVAQTLNNLGLLLLEQGRFEEARARFERALAIDGAVMAPGHPTLLANRANLGTALALEGRAAEALGPLERALEEATKALGPDHPAVGTVLQALGAASRRAGKPREAAAWLGRALELRERLHGSEHPDLGTTLDELCWAQRALAQRPLALQTCQRAAALLEKEGPRSPRLASPLTALGLLHLEEGDAAAARPPLEKALELRRARSREPGELAETAFALARVRLAQGDEAGARGLVAEVRGLGVRSAEDRQRLAAMDAWAAQRLR